MELLLLFLGLALGGTVGAIVMAALASSRRGEPD